MKRTLIAVAVLAAVSSSAFAHDRDKDSFLFNYTAVGAEVGVQGWVTLFGCVQVSSSAGAVVQNNQNVWANANLIDTQKPTVMTATTGSNAGSGISGNVGINITEGVDNAQSNDVSLASVDVGNVFGNAQIFNNQSSGGAAHVKNYTFNASIGDQSLGQVSGNVGVNVASGVGNAQNNSLAASTSLVSPGSASAIAMVATDDNDQSASMSFKGSMNGTAMLGANSLQGSQGNIGVNIAGGVGNVQHNGLAIAASSIGH